ncbi:MAG: hypothetical protein ACLFMX_05625 [Halobacteriales archaeon]
MSLPGPLEAVLGDEAPLHRVDLGDEDLLVTTPTRALRYRDASFLRDADVDVHPTAVDRLEVDAGRRRSHIRLVGGPRGTTEFAVPAASTDAAIDAVLASVLVAAGVVEPPERVEHTVRFDELTVALTDRRLLKHVGDAVWAGDFESIAFDDVRGVRLEEGRVAGHVVLVLADAAERIKVPMRALESVRDALAETLGAHHGVDSLEAMAPPAAPSGGASSPLLDEVPSLFESDEAASASIRADRPDDLDDVLVDVHLEIEELDRRLRSLRRQVDRLEREVTERDR